MKVSFTFSRFTGPTRITVLDEQGVPLRCSLKENISKCALKDEGECMGLWERVPLSALAYTVVHSPQLGAQPPVHALSNQTSQPYPHQIPAGPSWMPWEPPWEPLWDLLGTTFYSICYTFHKSSRLVLIPVLDIYWGSWTHMTICQKFPP